jgi:predicted nucleic acid-binding protein
MANVVREIFVDTNVLVYASTVNSPLRNQALKRIADLSLQGATLWISTQTIREFLTTMSRPNKLAQPVGVNTLINDVQNFLRDFKFAGENEVVIRELITILQKVTVQGSQIYDANIVATMQTYGIKEILTHNVADFTRYNAFISILPLV